MKIQKIFESSYRLFFDYFLIHKEKSILFIYVYKIKFALCYYMILFKGKVKVIYLLARGFVGIFL